MGTPTRIHQSNYSAAYSPTSSIQGRKSILAGRAPVTPSRLITPHSPVPIKYGINETVHDFNTPTKSRSGDLGHIDPDTKLMVEDAREDFSNPFVEIFDCDNCKFF
jgi:hypothetical protein